eukprot:jgi/Picre1/34730/NNA_002196.t1
MEPMEHTDSDDTHTESLTGKFKDTLHRILDQQECFQTTCHREKPIRKLAHKTRTALRKRNQARLEMYRNLNTDTMATYKALHQEARRLVRRDQTSSFHKFVHRAAASGPSSPIFWKFINILQGKQRRPQTLQPVKGPNNQLQLSNEAILHTTEQHYSTLAGDADTTTLASWAERCPLPQRPTVLELNRDITWPEIQAALATSATGKAPGMDGITNEVYKLCKEDTPRLEPTTPMGRMLLEAVNSIFHGDIPEDMHSSLIISIPKPHKDATLLDNHRGISLIDCLLKLTTRVISDRLHTHLIEGPRGLRKEQAGFRRLQECPAQAATLYEIALRRRQVNQVTFAAFIDLRKAFDMVPHRCLLHVLSSRGINGACLNFISTLYSHAGFKCSAGTLTSIDDTVILAESEAELQDSLNTFGDWCDRFGMEVGHAKCGVMALGVGDSTQLPRPTTGPFTIQRGTIPIVDKYTYLGIAVTPRLDVRTSSSTDVPKA